MATTTNASADETIRRLPHGVKRALIDVHTGTTTIDDLTDGMRDYLHRAGLIRKSRRVEQGLVMSAHGQKVLTALKRKYSTLY